MQSGIRIQKVLSDKGILSRRKTEEAIQKGRIAVNGHPATIGQRINIRKDIITLDGQRIRLEDRVPRVYLMLNKPRGYVTTTSDQEGRRTVLDLVKDVNVKVYPVGRLDMASEGLLLLTNDGNLANEIMHPSGEVTKTYRATIRGKVNEEDLIDLSTGVVLDDGYKTLPAVVHVITQEPTRTVLQITVHEGKNHLIRRMCKAVNLDLIRLKRTNVGPLKLGMLPPGKYRKLSLQELEALRGSVKKSQNRYTQNKQEEKGKEKRQKRRQGR